MKGTRLHGRELVSTDRSGNHVTVRYNGDELTLTIDEGMSVIEVAEAKH